MDMTTQQNAALVEESAAAADSLKQQAQHMVQAVAVFKLAGRSAVYASPIAAERSAAPIVSHRAPGHSASSMLGATAAALTGSARRATPSAKESDDWVSF